MGETVLTTFFLADTEEKLPLYVALDMELRSTDDDTGRRDETMHQRVKIEPERKFRDRCPRHAVTAVDAQIARPDDEISSGIGKCKLGAAHAHAVGSIRRRQRILDGGRQHIKWQRAGDKDADNFETGHDERADRPPQPAAAGDARLTPPIVARSLWRAGR